MAVRVDAELDVRDKQGQVVLAVPVDVVHALDVEDAPEDVAQVVLDALAVLVVVVLDAVQGAKDVLDAGQVVLPGVAVQVLQIVLVVH